MYNPRLFSVRQEYEMPAKKTASKKRKKATASRKKSVSKKATARKSTSKKRKVTKKKTSTSGRKKAASKKKSSSKKKAASKKAPSKKKVSKKKPAAKKASKKKVTVRKTASKKKVARKPAAKKHARTTAATRSASKKRVPDKNLGMRRGQPRGNVLTGPIHGIEPYKPKRGEDYMSPEQLEHFRKILTSWKRELMFEVDRTVHHMQDEAANFPDPNDRATQESEFGLELRTRDRERKLLRKIDSALSRIDDGSYGWCEETGEEIGLKRLEARPVATLCLEAQERREMAERQFRDRDDQYR